MGVRAGPARRTERWHRPCSRLREGAFSRELPVESSACSIATPCRMSLSSLVAPIWLMVCAVGGLLLGQDLEQRPLYGLLLGAAAGNLPFVLLGAGHAILMAWRPERPRCRCGRCGSEEYQLTGSRWRSSGSIILFYRCPACGRRYGCTGSRFLELGSPRFVSSYRKLPRADDKRGAPQGPPNTVTPGSQLQSGEATLR